MRDARLGLYDEITGLNLTAPRANLVMRAKGETIDTSFDADVLISGSASHVTAEITMPPGQRGRSRAAWRSRGWTCGRWARNAKLFDGVKDLPMVVSASTEFRVDAGGKLAQADFDIAATGEVPVRRHEGQGAACQQLRLVGRYDGATQHLALTTADLNAREARALFKGARRFLL